MLMTNSNFVGGVTGRSAGFAPANATIRSRLPSNKGSAATMSG